jgi:aminomethyltransferase
MGKRTSLFPEHVALGAKMIEFASWEMPAQYSGIIDEVLAVRRRVGVFDVSHMGEFEVTGPGASEFLQGLVTNNLEKMYDGRVQYNAMCLPTGGMIDDLLVYRFSLSRWMLVVNAANIDKDSDWITKNAPGSVKVEDATQDTTLIALQGPRAEDLLRDLTETDLSAIEYYHFTSGKVAGESAVISRTGYTGEDGFEMYLGNQSGPRVWRELLSGGKEFGIAPAGLGARDTLRLEAGFCLYGNEMDEETNPLEANLSWITKLKKGPFIGRDAIQRAKETGLAKGLVGFEMTERGVARHGYRVFRANDEIGKVSSGSYSPTLDKMIGMAHVRPDCAEPGTQIQIEIRGRMVAAVIVELPFYKRGSS